MIRITRKFLSPNPDLNSRSGSSSFLRYLSAFLDDVVNAINSIFSYDIGWSLITVGASPFTYTNATGFPVSVNIASGTVSSIQFSRGGSAFPLGITNGMVPLSPNDSVIVTYTVSPTMVLIPR